MRSRTKLITSACAVFSLVFFAIYAYAQVTLEDCESAFSSSSASNSCGALTTCNDDEDLDRQCVDTSQQDVSVSNGQCTVSVHCARNNAVMHAPTHNSFTGTTSELSSLNNCDGSLQVADC